MSFDIETNKELLQENNNINKINNQKLENNETKVKEQNKIINQIEKQNNN
ncbi:hypothetical protein [Spiroplasma endosymbiont of Colias croceus]